MCFFVIYFLVKKTNSYICENDIEQNSRKDLQICILENWRKL
jgi:hypothetical protein